MKQPILQPYLKRGIEKGQGANVEPEPADDRERDDLDDEEEGDLDDDVTEAHDAGGGAEAEERGRGVEEHEGDADDAVAAHGGQHPLEVGAGDEVLHLEAHDGEVADVVRAESYE